MESDNGKPLSVSQNSDQYTKSTNGSHDVTLDSTQRNFLENPKDLNEALSTDYHLTAEIPNSSLSQRDLSLLLEVLNYQIVYFGCNLSMYIGLCELYFRVKGNALTSKEVSIGKIRLTLMVSEILIGAFKETSHSLYSGEFTLISAKLRELLSPYLMTKRTYGSRFRTYRPEKFIRIKAVPVNRLIDRPQFRTERYSGYTKGYGESHGNAHRKKSKPSVELDGSGGPDKEERNLNLRMTDQEHVKPNSLWIKFRNLFWKD